MSNFLFNRIFLEVLTTFFNLINPVLAIIYAYLGVKILRIPMPDVAVEVGNDKIPMNEPTQTKI